MLSPQNGLNSAHVLSANLLPGEASLSSKPEASLPFTYIFLIIHTVLNYRVFCLVLLLTTCLCPCIVFVPKWFGSYQLEYIKKSIPGVSTSLLETEEPSDGAQTLEWVPLCSNPGFQLPSANSVNWGKWCHRSEPLQIPLECTVHGDTGRITSLQSPAHCQAHREVH